MVRLQVFRQLLTVQIYYKQIETKVAFLKIRVLYYKTTFTFYFRSVCRMFFERPFIIISFSSRHRVQESFQIPTQRQVQVRNGVIQTRLKFSIIWAIVKKIPAGRNGKRNCALCVEEKLMIMKGHSKNILNKGNRQTGKRANGMKNPFF